MVSKVHTTATDTKSTTSTKVLRKHTHMVRLLRPALRRPEGRPQVSDLPAGCFVVVVHLLPAARGRLPTRHVVRYCLFWGDDSSDDVAEPPGSVSECAQSNADSASPPLWRCQFPQSSKPPLPAALSRVKFGFAGWKAKTTPSGETYYANSVTKSTTWDRPVAPVAPQASSSHRRGSGSVASMDSSVGSGVAGGAAPLPSGTVNPVGRCRCHLLAGPVVVLAVTRRCRWRCCSRCCGGDRPAVFRAPRRVPPRFKPRGVTSWCSAAPRVRVLAQAALLTALPDERPPRTSPGALLASTIHPHSRACFPLGTAGWAAKTTSSGAVYFENRVAKTTTWDRPVAPAAAPQPEAPAAVLPSGGSQGCKCGQGFRTSDPVEQDRR